MGIYSSTNFTRYAKIGSLTGVVCIFTPLWLTRKVKKAQFFDDDPLFKSLVYLKLNPDGHRPAYDDFKRKLSLRQLREDLRPMFNSIMTNDLTADTSVEIPVWSDREREEWHKKILISYARGYFSNIAFAFQAWYLRSKYMDQRSTVKNSDSQLWTKAQLESSDFKPGTVIGDHFQVMDIESSPTGAVMTLRMGGTPFTDSSLNYKAEALSNAAPRPIDGLLFLPVRSNEYAATFSCASIYFNGTSETIAAQTIDGKEVGISTLGGSLSPLLSKKAYAFAFDYLHKLYVKMLVEGSVRSMQDHELKL